MLQNLTLNFISETEIWYAQARVYGKWVVLTYPPYTKPTYRKAKADLIQAAEGVLMQKKNASHLTGDDRVRIESLLREGCSLRYIAGRLDKSPSTISREVNSHARTIRPVRCDCIYRQNCTVRHACGAEDCRKKCRDCRKARVHCTEYVQSFCDKRLAAPAHLCNACPRQSLCGFERRVYEARPAEKEYRDTLTNQGDGFDLTAEQFRQIDEVVSPLVRRGQSIYHIVQTNRDILPVSESTIRRLISASELEVGVLDLPEAVKRRPRRKKAAPSAPPASKDGHLCQDYLSFIHLHDVPTVQMDCVEGRRMDRAAILTLHFLPFRMQLAFLLDVKNSASVVRMFDILEEALGKDLFASCLPLILTDNGTEFSDIDGMERSIYGGRRTMVFFCDPNRSDEKGACENNHKLIRDVIPKGTSLEPFSQAEISLLTNHINSYVRRSLFGKCPYDLAMEVLPEDFFLLLGLEKVPADKVILKPALLRRRHLSK